MHGMKISILRQSKNGELHDSDASHQNDNRLCFTSEPKNNGSFIASLLFSNVISLFITL